MSPTRPLKNAASCCRCSASRGARRGPRLAVLLLLVVLVVLLLVLDSMLSRAAGETDRGRAADSRQEVMSVVVALD